MREGDRVELLDLPNDARRALVPVGTRGTVEGVRTVSGVGETFVQVSVRWDNGRTLMLSIPPDRVRVLAPE